MATRTPISTDQMVVISGAGSGIGFATARHLSDLGYTVIAGVRSQAQGDRLLDGAGPSLIPFSFDVTRDEDISSVVAQVSSLRDDGRVLRGIFSNAGVEGRSSDKSAEGCSIEALEQVMDVNYFGAVRFIRGFLPMARADQSTIVINSALMARIVLPFNAGYAPSKAALESWAITLRREIAAHGVKVTLIELGGIATPLTSSAGGADEPNPLYPQQEAVTREFAALAQQAADHPRMQPDAVAQIVARALATDSPRHRYLGGGGARRLSALASLPQRVQDRLITRMLSTGTKARPRH